MDNDEALIEALESAGHTEQAKQLRDRQLAKQLRNAGREDLADQLEGNPAPAPERPKSEQKVHAERVVEAIRQGTGRDLTRDPEAA